MSDAHVVAQRVCHRCLASSSSDRRQFVCARAVVFTTCAHSQRWALFLFSSSVTLSLIHNRLRVTAILLLATRGCVRWRLPQQQQDGRCDTPAQHKLIFSAILSDPKYGERAPRSLKRGCPPQQGRAGADGDSTLRTQPRSA